MESWEKSVSVMTGDENGKKKVLNKNNKMREMNKGNGNIVFFLCWNEIYNLFYGHNAAEHNLNTHTRRIDTIYDTKLAHKKPIHENLCFFLYNDIIPFFKVFLIVFFF